MDADRQAPADLISCWWRTGRRNARVIYAQHGDFAADEDQMIGSFDTPELALAAVRAHNTLFGRASKRAEPADVAEDLPDDLPPCPSGCTTGCEDCK